MKFACTSTNYSSPTAGLAEAVATGAPKIYIDCDGAWTNGNAAVDLSGLQIIGVDRPKLAYARVVFRGPNFDISGVDFYNSLYAAVAVDSTSHGIIRDCAAYGFNTANVDGHGAFTSYGQCDDLIFDNLTAADGHGNGVRISGTNQEVLHCIVSRTSGKGGSEGIAATGSRLKFIENTIMYAWVNGILIWASAACDTLEFSDNWFVNVSEGSAQGQVSGHHSGVVLNSLTSKISNVTFNRNRAFDFRPSSQTISLLQLQGTGQVVNVRGICNAQRGCIKPDDQLVTIDSGVQASGIQVS